MVGRLLEVTGDAAAPADTLINRFGERRVPLSLGVASLLFGFPIFFDAGLVVMLPIIFSVARRFGGSAPWMSSGGGRVRRHVRPFVPPHPGPVAVVAARRRHWARRRRRPPHRPPDPWDPVSAIPSGTSTGCRLYIPVPRRGRSPAASRRPRRPRTGRRPRFGRSCSSSPAARPHLPQHRAEHPGTAGVVDGDATWVGLLRMFGQTAVALLITVIVASVVLSGGRSRADLKTHRRNSALGPVCAIILITGAGGMFGGVLRASGIGEALAGSLEDTGLPGHRRGLPRGDRPARRAGVGDRGPRRRRRASSPPRSAATAARRASTSRASSSRSPAARPCSRTSTTPAFGWSAASWDGREDHVEDPDGDGDPHRDRRLRAGPGCEPPGPDAPGTSSEPSPSRRTHPPSWSWGSRAAAKLPWPGDLARYGPPFAEADGFHPTANIEQISAGTPLTDDDRLPWREGPRRLDGSSARAGHATAPSGSALRRTYRDVLRYPPPDGTSSTSTRPRCPSRGGELSPRPDRRYAGRPPASSQVATLSHPSASSPTRTASSSTSG